jgi:hypothetical protein
LKQMGSVEEFIATFEKLDFRTNDMTYAIFMELFISGIKDEIHVHVLMAHPQTWFEATKRTKEAQQSVSSQTQKTSFIPHHKPTLLLPSRSRN